MNRINQTRQYAALVFFFAFVVYLFPLVYDLAHKPFFNWAPSQDIVSTSLLPIEILQRGDFTLDRYSDFIAEYFRDPYFVARVNGKIISRYPVAAAMLALPFYGVPLGAGWIQNPPYAWLAFPWSAFFPAKFAAAFITALAVLMFYFCARELTNVKSSAALALVFAFGTSVWSTASQALWQHTPSLLFQLIGVWFLLRDRRAGMNGNAIAASAFFFSAAVVARANVALTAILFTFYILLAYRSKKIFLQWIVGAIPPLVLFLLYNTAYNGSPFVFGYQDGIANYIQLPQAISLAGLFVSPSRGLFIFSPFFLFAIVGARFALRAESKRFFIFSALTVGIGVLVLSMWENWDGGWGYGTRLLTDLLPYALFLLIPFFEQLSPRARKLFWTLVAYSIIVNAFALWDYGVRWHWSWDNYAYDVWNWERNQPLFYLREYFAMGQQFLSRFIP